MLGIHGGDLFGRRPCLNLWACGGRLPRASTQGEQPVLWRIHWLPLQRERCCVLRLCPSRIVKADQRLDWVISKVARF